VIGDWVCAVSDNARILVFPVTEMKEQSGGRGIIVMGLDKDAMLAAVAVPDNEAGLTVSGIGRGAKDQELAIKPSQLELWRHRRARKGMALPSKIKPTGAR